MSTGRNSNGVGGGGELNSQLHNETKVTFNKVSNGKPSAINSCQNTENGVEATNMAAEAASTATMDEFRRSGIVMMAKMEENG